MFFVYRGQVKYLMLSSKGKEQILGFITHLGCFGDPPMFHGEPIYISVVALEDTELFYLTKTQVMEEIKRNPEIVQELVCISARRAKTWLQLIQLLSFMNPQDRLKYFLYSNLTEYHIASPPCQEWLELPVKFTQEQIADIIAVTRVTIARLFHKLKKSNVIRNSEGKFWVNRRLLAEFDHERS